MKPTSQRWKQIGECRVPWEREALEFVREGLPDLEPYRAWANVEFLGVGSRANSGPWADPVSVFAVVAQIRRQKRAGMSPPLRKTESPLRCSDFGGS